MLLQRLHETGTQREHEALPQQEELPAGYTHQTMAWIIQLDTHGHLEGVIPTASGRARSAPGLRLAVPYLRHRPISTTC